MEEDIERYINPRRVPRQDSIQIFPSDPRNNRKFLLKNPNTIVIGENNSGGAGVDESSEPDASSVSDSSNVEVYAVAAFEEENSNGRITMNVYLNVSDVPGAVSYHAEGGQID